MSIKSINVDKLSTKFASILERSLSMFANFVWFGAVQKCANLVDPLKKYFNFQTKYLLKVLAKIGSDTTDNEPSEVIKL